MSRRSVTAGDLWEEVSEAELIRERNAAVRDLQREAAQVSEAQASCARLVSATGEKLEFAEHATGAALESTDAAVEDLARTARTQAETWRFYGSCAGAAVGGALMVGLVAGGPVTLAAGMAGGAYAGATAGQELEVAQKQQVDKEMFAHALRRSGKWIDDTDPRAAACMTCTAAFSFVLRRHHCRACGGVFCYTCASRLLPFRVLDANDNVSIHNERVCEACFAEHWRDGRHLASIA